MTQSQTGQMLILGLPIEVLALAVASLGLIASLGALGWQLAKHVLDGGRVRAYLNVGIWEPNYALRMNRSGHHLLRSDDDTAATFRDHFETAQLVIENPGRTAVTVYSPGLAITGTGARQHSLTPRMFDLGEGFGADKPSTANVVRLEPYDRVSFYFDYWSVVPDLLSGASKDGITIRGYICVAGRSNKPQRSSWRKRWRIPQGAYTAITGNPQIAPFTVIWRELWRATPETDELGDDRRSRVTRGRVKYILERAMRKFDTVPPKERLQEVMEAEALKAGDQYPVIHLSLFEGYESLARLEAHLGPWNWVFEDKPPRSPQADADTLPSKSNVATQIAPPSSRRATREGSRGEATTR